MERLASLLVARACDACRLHLFPLARTRRTVLKKKKRCNLLNKKKEMNQKERKREPFYMRRIRSRKSFSQQASPSAERYCESDASFVLLNFSANKLRKLRGGGRGTQ